jgi:hypothetical protein
MEPLGCSYLNLTGRDAMYTRLSFAHPPRMKRVDAEARLDHEPYVLRVGSHETPLLSVKSDSGSLWHLPVATQAEGTYTLGKPWFGASQAPAWLKELWRGPFDMARFFSLAPSGAPMAPLQDGDGQPIDTLERSSGPSVSSHASTAPIAISHPRPSSPAPANTVPSATPPWPPAVAALASNQSRGSTPTPCPTLRDDGEPCVFELPRP